MTADVHNASTVYRVKCSRESTLIIAQGGLKLKDKIDYTELRKIIRDLHDYIRHPERVDDHDAATTIALACLPHPLLMAEQLVRERELRVKAQREAAYNKRHNNFDKMRLAVAEALLAAYKEAAKEMGIVLNVSRDDILNKAQEEVANL